MNTKIRRLLATVLTIAMLLTLSPAVFAVGGKGEVFDGRVFVSDVATQLAPGAKEHVITTNNTTGTDQNIDFLCEVDLSNTSTIKIMSCYAGYGTCDLAGDGTDISWQMMTMPEQAAKAQAYFDAHQDKYPNYKVVGAIVGDTYNMGTGQPTAALVMGGKTYQSPNGAYYFAVTKDGKAMVTNSTDTSNLESAVGGMGLIVKDGKNVASGEGSYAGGSFSRSAVGVTAEGKVVMFTTYGNSYPISCGYTWPEVADYLIAQGCVDALMLDGSGSAEWCSRMPGTDSVVSRSHPSDGSSRAVGSCLLVVSTAAPDGVLDHVTITPDRTVYTPGSSVTFSAVGSDSAGDDVNLDSGEWRLASDSEDKGSMSGSVFTSNGTVGDVTVEYCENGKVYGSATVTIAKPDSITFAQETVEMGRGESSDLGLQVRYQTRDVVLKAGDLNTAMTVDAAYSDITAIGSVDANTYKFTSIESSCSGTVTFTSAYDTNVTGTVNVTVGKEPVKALDFEPVEGKTLQEYYGLDENNYIVGRTGDSETYVAATGLLTRRHYSGRRSDETSVQETARLVSVADGYPVHSGEYALQVNYDFSNCLSNTTEGANVGLSQALDIPGTPTAIGLWVYIPKGTPNLWLRVRLKITNADGQTNETQFDFGRQINKCFPVDGSYGGLCELAEGSWVFCQADLSQFAGCTFSIPTGEAIRLMRTNGNKEYAYNGKTVTQSHGKYLRDGTEVTIENCKGSVYFDDMMFIYGATNEDSTAPVVTESSYHENNVKKAVLSADSVTEIQWDSSATSNTFEFFAADNTSSIDGNTPTGLDPDACFVYLDGELMNGKFGTNIDVATSSIRIYPQLAEGVHNIRLLLSDKNGNRSNTYYTFRVTKTEAETYSTFSVDTEQTIAPLGGAVNVDFRASDLTKLTKLTATVEVDGRYKDGGYTITGCSGFTYNNDAVFNEVDNTVTFSVSKTDSSAAADGEKVCTIAFDIDKSLAQGSYFTYQVIAGQVEVEGATEDVHLGFASGQVRLTVDAPYTVESGLLYAGMSGGTLSVKDRDGKPVAGIPVYKVGETESIGATDKDGVLVLPDELTAEGGRFQVYASGEGGISFNADVTVNTVAADSSAVMFTVADDPTTQKNFSWLTPVNDKVSARCAASEEALETAEPVEVTKTVLSFTTGAMAGQANAVQLTGLTPGTTYYYQLSSDGETWTETATFSTDSAASAGDSTELFVLGDVQAKDLTNINKILSKLSAEDYDLGIQTGDLVDSPTTYSQWLESASVFSALGDQNMMYALGNHEDNMGDDGSLAETIYQMKNKSYYTVEVGNVFIANIAYNSQTGYKPILEQLVKDANASDAAWKIVVMHQPTYYSNSTATDNTGMDTFMPPYLEEAGINVVFSGHDHSYSRTAALVGGEIAESYAPDSDGSGTRYGVSASSLAGDGIVYYICGSSGEKSYPVDTTLPWIKDGRMSSTNAFNAICLKVSADEDKLVISTYDLVGPSFETEEDPDNGVSLDLRLQSTYTMYADECSKSGNHVFSESSEYDPSADTLTCLSCKRAIDAAKSGYTGKAACGDEQVYLFNGKVQIGWVTIGENVVHAGKDGILHSTISFTTETCTENGTRMAYCEDCKETKSYGTTVRYHNHSYDENHKCTNTYYDENHQIHECGWTGVDINSLNPQLTYRYYAYTGTTRKPGAIVKDGDYVLTNQSTYGDYVIYYSNNVEVGMATALLVAYNSYYGEATLKYEIRPSNVESLTATVLSEDSIRLDWSESKGAEFYYIYRVNGDGTLEQVAKTDDKSCTYTLTGLDAGAEYTYKICGAAIVEDLDEPRLSGSNSKLFLSNRYSPTATAATPAHDCPSERFTDVDTSRFYHKALDWAVENNVAKGNTETTFAPDESCTRAQLVTMLWRAAGSPAPAEGTENPFTDVPENVFYTDAVLWAVEKGIIKGTTETTFSPDDIATRGQVVTVLYRYSGSPAPAEGAENPFTDVPENVFYTDAVLWAVDNGVTNGTDADTFEPNLDCTRSQIVTFIYRCFVK